MWGYTGSFGVLLPNGLSAFRFADGQYYDVHTMVLAGEALRPFPCPAGSAEAPPPARQPLTASKLRTELACHTLYSGPMHMFPSRDLAHPLLAGHVTLFVAADGVLYGTFKVETDLGTEYDVGRWHITADGQFCRQWHVWGSQREHCFAVYRDGETFDLQVRDRWGTVSLRRNAGNPERY